MEHGTRVNEFYHRENIYFAFMQFVDSVPSAKKKTNKKNKKQKSLNKWILYLNDHVKKRITHLHWTLEILKSREICNVINVTINAISHTPTSKIYFEQRFGWGGEGVEFNCNKSVIFWRLARWSFICLGLVIGTLEWDVEFSRGWQLGYWKDVVEPLPFFNGFGYTSRFVVIS